MTIASNEYRADMPSPTDLSSTNLLDRWRDMDYSRRRYRRWRINEKAVVKYSGAAHDCLERDISPGGAKIEIDSEKALAVNDRINFELDGYDPLYSEVRHITDGRLGIVFLTDDQAQLAFAEWLTYLVKLVENWWCPFAHENKDNYDDARIDYSYWHDTPNIDQLHPRDRENPIWNQDARPHAGGEMN